MIDAKIDLANKESDFAEIRSAMNMKSLVFLAKVDPHLPLDRAARVFNRYGFTLDKN